MKNEHDVDEKWRGKNKCLETHYLRYKKHSFFHPFFSQFFIHPHSIFHPVFHPGFHPANLDFQPVFHPVFHPVENTGSQPVVHPAPHGRQGVRNDGWGVHSQLQEKGRAKDRSHTLDGSTGVGGLSYP